ncbi:MAG TPA: Holliday junction branch migration protein RuvA [Acidimicrobiales bacterium]|nr:Holliday junction branch migration protein RuvA [Acidimicrobiales bacterium]
MIGALTGSVAAVEPSGDHAVEVEVDVQGVGYRVLVGAREAVALPPLGDPVALSIHTHVREGELTLYGFGDRAGRRAFELLITAHGVGPALALAILSVHTPASLAQAVSEADLDQLCLVPGIGRKTAQRLCIELSSRLEVLAPAFVPSAAGSDAGGRGEVREALLALGYRNEEIRAVLEGLPPEGAVEALLREALAALAPQR